MKRLLNLGATALIAVACMTPAWAQDGAARQNQNQRPTNQNPNSDRADAGRLDSATSGANIRVSQLTGMSIQNPQGKDLGDINDLVIDANTGKIRYAAVTYGGFLGIGNKMFAVPFEAFKIQRERDDADDFVLVLDVNQQQLEGAVGFDENNWPNFADENFTKDLDIRYHIDRNMRDRDQGNRGVDVNVDRNGVDVDVQGNRDQ